MIAFRDATIADGPALDTMARQVWIDTFGHSASAENVALYLADAYGPGGQLIRDLADPTHHFHVAVADAAIAAFAKLSPVWIDLPTVLPGALQLSQFYVDPAWHGAGVAQTLMERTIATARARGATALVLTVWEENGRARRFYDRQGFTHIGDYGFRTGNQIDHDLVMQRVL